jgi:hypothetical protein
MEPNASTTQQDNSIEIELKNKTRQIYEEMQN